MLADDGTYEQAVRNLCGPPAPLTDAGARLTASPGIYAWWGPDSIFPELSGPANAAVPSVRLLYLGIATRLRRRIMSNHLGRSGRSTLRRTLAGLLLDEEGYRTTWTDRVVLVPDDEPRLTAWMHQHLSLTWVVYPVPRSIERQLIAQLRPPLNVEGAERDASREAIQKARAAYRASAGPRSETL